MDVCRVGQARPRLGKALLWHLRHTLPAVAAPDGGWAGGNAGWQAELAQGGALLMVLWPLRNAKGCLAWHRCVEGVAMLGRSGRACSVQRHDVCAGRAVGRDKVAGARFSGASGIVAAGHDLRCGGGI